MIVPAREQNIRPSERRDVRQELWGNAESGALVLRGSMAQVNRVPVDDDGGKEVQACHAVALAFAGAVADLTLAADPQSVLERVMRFALVEPAVRAAPHSGAFPSRMLALRKRTFAIVPPSLPWRTGPRPHLHAGRPLRRANVRARSGGPDEAEFPAMRSHGW